MTSLEVLLHSFMAPGDLLHNPPHAATPLALIRKRSRTNTEEPRAILQA